MKAKIYYFTLQDEQTKEEKLEWFEQTRLEQIPFEHVTPDRKHNWVNLTDNDFDDFLPLLDKDVKGGSSNKAIFVLFSRGLETTRDDWVYDLDKENLTGKTKYLSEKYNSSIEARKKDISIKWSSSLDSYFEAGVKSDYSQNFIRRSTYRPYFDIFHYAEKLFNHRLTKNHYEILGEDFKSENLVIGINIGNPNFASLATNTLLDQATLKFGNGSTQCLPLYRYDENGTRIDNITDWGLTQFQTHYNDPTITKLHIFHYTYAVLHHPAYRTKYELNLKREFPRLPYYPDFHQWATWGKALMDLHLTYETAEPFGLKRIDQSSPEVQNDAPLQTSLIPNDAPAKPKKTPKPKLKADKTNGHIILDTDTTLTGVPAVAWDYKLGNRSALEWILDQYKEKTPKDPTIRELFNTYRFADYKEHVIDLLQRVCTVSVETMHIIHQMPATVEHQGEA
ncbi:type ISP restriction/modification enzyme [Leptolyngbya sp. KIOST-1]|uniref:type ISP restriction/modification enzyme n=1 Tax=Leptolyngbya sp. KIOST-1 TaxID=1229172 RepID=UPI0009079957|nr:type ISP restriction/modification enzyme [Leptolyngbya sp. KIOST-1]